MASGTMSLNHAKKLVDTFIYLRFLTFQVLTEGSNALAIGAQRNCPNEKKAKSLVIQLSF